MTAAQETIAAAMTESELQTNVIDLAHTYGWLIHHCRPAANRDGRWSTPIQGDPGFPDLVLVHERRGLLIFAELKRQRGRSTTTQDAWQLALLTVEPENDVVRVYTWRPANWLNGDIRAVLDVKP